MSEAIKAADAKIGKWYWIKGKAWLAIDRNSYHNGMEFYHPRPGIESFGDYVIPLPDDAGYDYVLPPPEPAYRPFASAAEFEPHEGRRWRYVTDLVSQRRITAGYNDVIHHADSWDICFKQRVFCDGSPFGVEVTQ